MAGPEPHDKPRWTFSDIARATSIALGSPWAFFAACLLVIAWAAAGPVFGFSDAWQLVINTGTTIGTFLIVFLIQNTQNHDARALHLKLDELIRSIDAARNRIIDLETSSDAEMDDLQREFRRLSRRRDTPEVARPTEAAVEPPLRRQG